MSVIQAVILGIVQGVTEFFPISSSGHLVLMQSVFGLKGEMLAFDVFLHFGTIVSVLVFFRKDIAAIFRGDISILKFIILGSIPTFIIAILLKKRVEGFFENPVVVGYCLIATGLFLLVSSGCAFYNKKMKREKSLGLSNSIAIGIAQGIAVIPGISRSGATIGTSLISGLGEGAAVKFSFLLSIPAVLGANILKAKDICGNLITVGSLPFIAGALSALIAGILTIRVLVEILKKNLFFLFGIYCVLIGAAAILFMRG